MITKRIIPCLDVRSGFDLEMLDAVAARVNVPIIASGGAGKMCIRDR